MLLPPGWGAGEQMLPAAVTRHARWNGVSSSRPTGRTRDSAPRRGEQGRKLGCRPAGIASRRPAVVIEPAPKHHLAGIV